MQANTNTIGALVQTYITSHSEVQKARLSHTPALPSILHQPFRIEPTHETSCAADQDTIKQLFPYTYGQHAVTFVSSIKEVKHQHHMNVGIVLSGGPAPGGHNVISGLFDYLTYHHCTYKAYGFLDGPSGIIDGKYITITDDIVKQYRNAGGFHMIGSGRTKIETPQQFAKALATVNKLELDGLIVVGGDDSNTNAALLAEFFKKEKCRTKVIGVPKTIDGDLRNEYVETSFGFDTATKVYSEKIAALADDAVSARKTYHFCRLMGRTASHITLECALQTHPNIALIGEEIKAKKITLHQLVGEISDAICARAARGKNYGIVILPEGLVDFLVDISQLLQELDELIASAGGHPPANVAAHLSEPSAALFGSLPTAISSQLLLDRDPHGNVQVSKIESERLLAQMVEAELNRRKQKNLYGGTPSIVCHFLGYEGRCGLPSNFDVNYCYALGHVAGALLSYGYTGMMAVVSDLTLPVEQWKCGGMPLTHMMNIERRKGHSVPVIRKALVDLNSAPFQIFAAARDSWKLTDSYRNPGSIQYFGPLANSINLTLAIEKQTEQYQRQQANLKNALQSKL